MPRFPGFIGGSATPQSLIADAEQTVNLYVERAPQEARAENVAALLPTPGFAAWSTGVTDANTRALAVANGRMFGVVGGGFYEFDSTGKATRWGAVGVDANPAQIVFDGVVGGQLGIAAGGNIYAFTLSTNTLSGALLNGGYSHLAYAGGFGLAFNTNTGVTTLSKLNDLTVWSGGNFFQRSLFADPPRAIFVDANNLVWTLGTETFEVRYNAGSGTQPFVPLTGLAGAYGIAAPFAFGKSARGYFWLSSTADGVGELVLTRGSVPAPVSTYPVNTAIAGYLRASSITDAEAMTYQQEGHTFGTMTFPSAQAALPAMPTTWAVDLEQQSWTQRGHWTNGRWEVWAPRVHCVFNGKHLVGDRATNTIWQMDTSIGTDVDGQGVLRVRQTPHINREHAREPIDQFELLMDVGLGVAVGQGSDPRVMLRVSTDGGRTFGNERQAGVGRQGDWKKRVYWTRLGAPADAVLRVSYSEPTPFRLADAFINNKEAA